MSNDFIIHGVMLACLACLTFLWFIHHQIHVIIMKRLAVYEETISLQNKALMLSAEAIKSVHKRIDELKKEMSNVDKL